MSLSSSCATPPPGGTVPETEIESEVQSASSSLPASEVGALAALESSPRHGEWVDIEIPGSDQSINAWLVYPERADNAPAVLVVHEIYGLTDWIRGVADQLAAAGFVAIAPDLLSGKGPGGGGTDSVSTRDEVVKLVRSLTPKETISQLNLVRDHVLGLSAVSGKLASIGFCWGGMTSFAYAVAQPKLDAAIVYYGTSPDDPEVYKEINAAVLGLYGEDDARVNTTIPMAVSEMAKLGKTYEPNIYEAAGHGFLRAQEDRDGANMKATEQAWPRTLEFLKLHTEEGQG